jgi:RecA-family ATPase
MKNRIPFKIKLPNGPNKWWEIEITEEAREQLRTQKRISYEELLALNVQELPTLWGGVINPGKITVLGGPSDCNKSTFALDLTMAVCNGDTEFMGSPLDPKYKKAIYVSTEDDNDSMSFRLGKRPKPSQPSHYPIILTDDEDIDKKVREEFKTSPFDLIVIDAFGDLQSEDSNKMENVREFMKVYQNIARDFNVAILFIHHVSKAGSSKAAHKNNLSGSHGIEAKARSVLMMERLEGNRRRLVNVKGNHTADKDKSAILMELNPDTISLEYIGREDVSVSFKMESLTKQVKALTDEQVQKNPKITVEKCWENCREEIEASRSTYAKALKLSKADLMSGKFTS